MKIKIALIPCEHICKAEDLCARLLIAMEAGEMRAVDQTTKKILSLTDNDYSLSLPEESWHKLIELVRSIDGNFKSDYLLAKPQLEKIIAADVADSFADIANIVELALKTQSVVLQLPFEEEDDDV